MGQFYVSLTGNQIMGTLQPLLGAAAHYGTLAGACFLATPQTRKNAERLCAYALAHKLLTSPAMIVDISLSSDSLLPALETARTAAGDNRLLFNLEGGMTAMLVPCALALASFSPLFMQAAHGRVTLSDPENGTHTPLPLPAPLFIEDILTLQGVTCTTGPLGDWSVRQFCERGNLALPDGALYGVVIDDVFFEVVWNAGNNRPSFLASLLKMQGEKTERLAAVRSLMHWCASRERSRHLFDRTVHVLAGSDDVKEHLEHEAGGKLKVYSVNNWRAESSCLRSALEIIFKPWAPAAITKKAAKKTKSRIHIVNSNTLVTLMGKSPAATIKALYSHRLPHLVVCGTENVKEVKDSVDALWRLHEPWLESVEFVPANIEGTQFEDSLALAEDAVNVQVNVSPGSKGQGVFLALWARQRGLPVWGIDPNGGHCQPFSVPENCSAPALSFCSPCKYLQICGQTLLSSALPVEAMEDKPLYETLYAFLRAAVVENTVQNIFKKDVAAGGMRVRPLSKTLLEFVSPALGAVQIPLKGGEWFEKLTGYAFAMAGAEDVCIRVRAPWSEKQQKELDEKYGDKAAQHRLDMDVVGRWGSEMLMVSCKSFPWAIEPEVAEEARNMAINLGRFALPLVCHAGCGKSYIHSAGNVRVLGLRELAQPDALRALLNTAFKAARQA